MKKRFRRARFEAAILITILLSVHAVQAASPANLWSASGIRKGFFSNDGSWVVALGTSSAGGRIEIRDVGSGVLLRAATAVTGFDAAALTQDKAMIAASTAEVGSGKHPVLTRKIYLFRTSDGALIRSIVTDAQRSISSLDFSPDGQLLASMDELSYGQGGRVRVFRVSDGRLVRALAAGNQSTAVRFSPNGQYLAVNDQNISSNGIIGGVRVFRTSDWASVMTMGQGCRVVQWSPDTSSLWIKNLWDGSKSSAAWISVPGGTILTQVVTPDYTNVWDASWDNRLLLADRAAAPQNVVRFLNVSTGAIDVTYSFPTNAFAGDISPAGDVFTYWSADTSGHTTLFVARVP